MVFYIIFKKAEWSKILYQLNVFFLNQTFLDPFNIQVTREIFLNVVES